MILWSNVAKFLPKLRNFVAGLPYSRSVMLFSNPELNPRWFCQLFQKPRPKAVNNLKISVPMV